MPSAKFIVVFTVATLIVTGIAVFGQYISTRRLMKIEEDARLEYEALLPADITEVRYKCCDHCGLNFPEPGQSICEDEPNSHTVPCNEPGFCIGKEVVL